MNRFRDLLVIASLITTACTASSPKTPPPPPPPAPAPVVAEPPLAVTLDEALAIRKTDPVRFERALTALSTSSDPLVARRALAHHGLFLAGEGRHDEAVGVLRRAAAANSVAAPYLLLRAMESEESQRNWSAAAKTAADIIAIAPASTAASIARLNVPGFHAALGNREAADAAVASTNDIPIDEHTEPELVALASALQTHGRSDLATAVRLRLLTTYTQGRFTEGVYRAVADAADAPLEAMPVERAVALAQRLAANFRFTEMFDLLERIEKRDPAAAATVDYRSMRHRALFNSRKYEQLLEETAKEKPATAAQALLRARAAWRADKDDVFLAGLADLEKRWPSSKEAIEARVLRSKFYTTDIVDYARSLADLGAAIAAGAYGNDGENLWTLGWTQLLSGDSGKALTTFAEYVRRYPDGDYASNSLFWSGKVLHQLGRASERDEKWAHLIGLYPYSYFSYRARQLGDAAGSDFSKFAPPRTPSSFPDIDAQLAAVLDPRIDAVRELVELDLLRDAAREMKAVAASHAQNQGVQFMLADLYVIAGEPFKATGILQRHFREFVRHGGAGIPRRFWEILFPLPPAYRSSIETAAARARVDPWLVAAIIRQESGFEPTTVSNAGAVGLMQIMPAEATKLGELAGVAGVTRDSLFDPEINIRVGAAEYAEKLQLMNGNEVLAIAAYNAGPTAVGRWLAQTPVDDIDLFVEAIPFAETRLYVKTVQRSRLEYRRIYEATRSAFATP